MKTLTPLSYRIGLTLSLICLSVLELEIALTRVFAALLNSQMVLMVLSLTICGMGLGGMVVSGWIFFAPASIRSLPQKPEFVEIFSLLFGLSIPCMLYGLLQTPESDVATTSFWNAYYWALIFWATMPFFFAGIAISSLFECYSEQAETLYFYDLCGASLGCLTIILKMEAGGGPIRAISSIPLVLGIALAIFRFFPKPKRTYKDLGFGILLFGYLLLGIFFVVKQPFSLDYRKVGTQTAVGKALLEENGQIVRTKWDSYSRTDLVEYPKHSRFAGEKQLFINTGKRARLLQKGIARQTYTRDIAFLPFAYFQKLKETSGAGFSVLNLGSGGGYDTRLALFCKATEITLVEINPLVVDFVEEEKEFAGALFHFPEVRIYVDEARSFLRKTSKTYDVIHSSLTSSLAFEESSQLSFYESYFYTQEAMGEYLSRLNKNGILSIIIERDDLRDKLVATFLAHFQSISGGQKKISDGMQQLAILTIPKAGGAAYSNLILAKNTPFTTEESLLLEELASPLQGYIPQSSQRHFQQSPFSDIAQGKLDVFGPQGWIDSYTSGNVRFNIVPPTDDKPFFFNHQVGWDKRLLDLAGKVFFYVILLPLMLFFYPRKSPSKQGQGMPLWKLGVAFSLLGMGFILLEIALLKQFILYLSYPTLTLSTTLFGLLFSAGMGAYCFRRVPDIKKFKGACLLIFTNTLLWTFLLPPLMNATLGFHTVVRCGICLGVVASIGIVLGVPFPCLLRTLKVRYPGWVPLALALNGSISVLGSIFMILIALERGIQETFLFGSFLYLILACLIRDRDFSA